MATNNSEKPIAKIEDIDRVETEIAEDEAKAVKGGLNPQPLPPSPPPGPDRILRSKI